MPGRGQPWKIGGLRDGSVTEADIDPAYQAIIEGGGGSNLEKLVDVTQSTDQQTLLGSLSSAVNFSAYSHFYAIVFGEGVLADTWEWYINNITSGYQDDGNDSGSGWEAVTFSNETRTLADLTFSGLGIVFPSINALMRHAENSSGRERGGSLNTSPTQLNEVSLKAITGNILTGTKLVVWGYKL